MRLPAYVGTPPLSCRKASRYGGGCSGAPDAGHPLPGLARHDGLHCRAPAPLPGGLCAGTVRRREHAGSGVSGSVRHGPRIRRAPDAVPRAAAAAGPAPAIGAPPDGLAARLRNPAAPFARGRGLPDDAGRAHLPGLERPARGAAGNGRSGRGRNGRRRACRGLCILAGCRPRWR